MKKIESLPTRFRYVSSVLVSAAIAVMFNMSCMQSGSGESAGNDTLPKLDELYSEYFTIGAAVSTRSLSDSVSTLRVKEYFNSITAENSMKWEEIHPEPGVYNFENTDKFVEFGVQNNMEIIGHVLVWHSQTPRWVFHDEEGNRVSRDTLLSRMQDHINTVVSRYKGKVKYWDVVNEAIADDATFRQNIWAQIIGEDYVLKAFEFAHEADPDAKLIYNDYSLPTEAKRNAVVKMVKDIKAQGGQVDVIGMQGHYHLDYPYLSSLDSSIVAFHELGCQVHITELDINVLPNPFDTEEMGADIRKNLEYTDSKDPWKTALPDSMQTVLANRYTDFFKLFIKHKDIVDRVTFWGVQDGTSWLNHWPIRGRTNYPLLFDREYQPKKAYFELAKLVEE